LLLQSDNSLKEHQAETYSSHPHDNKVIFLTNNFVGLSLPFNFMQNAQRDLPH